MLHQASKTIKSHTKYMKIVLFEHIKILRKKATWHTKKTKNYPQRAETHMDKHTYTHIHTHSQNKVWKVTLRKGKKSGELLAIKIVWRGIFFIYDSFYGCKRSHILALGAPSFLIHRISLCLLLMLKEYYFFYYRWNQSCVSLAFSVFCWNTVEILWKIFFSLFFPTNTKMHKTLEAIFFFFMGIRFWNFYFFIFTM